MAVEGLSIRLYLDHNAHRRLARDLSPRGFEVTVADDLGNREASDEEHLQGAAERGVVVFTFDVTDFRVIAKWWAEDGRQHAGIILSTAPSRIAYGELLRRLLAFLDTVPADEMIDQVRWLDPSSALNS